MTDKTTAKQDVGEESASKTLAEKIRGVLEDKKGSDIAIVDVRESSSVTDYYVVVSGLNPPHIKAMFNEVQVQLKDDDIMFHRKAGDPESGWLVIDYFDVVVHILQSDIRERYALEELWEKISRGELDGLVPTDTAADRDQPAPEE
jgi:ribosome-associated protein